MGGGLSFASSVGGFSFLPQPPGIARPRQWSRGRPRSVRARKRLQPESFAAFATGTDPAKSARKYSRFFKQALPVQQFETRSRTVTAVHVILSSGAGP